MFCMLKRKTYLAYFSKLLKPWKKVILLTISNKEIHEVKSEGQQQWHYLAVKKTISIVKRNNL